MDADQRRLKPWRFHVSGRDNKVVYVSEYDYDSQEEALRAAAEYVKPRVPRDEVWTTIASYR
jgi:hypothetical protein